MRTPPQRLFAAILGAVIGVGVVGVPVHARAENCGTHVISVAQSAGGEWCLSGAHSVGGQVFQLTDDAQTPSVDAEIRVGSVTAPAALTPLGFAYYLVLGTVGAAVGADYDSDGIPDGIDYDADNDGVCDPRDADGVNGEDDPPSAYPGCVLLAGESDPSPLDWNRCGDADGDDCDDCSLSGDDEIGDTSGPGADFDVANDGTDVDADGLCDGGADTVVDNIGGAPDPDQDNDGICDSVGHPGWDNASVVAARHCTNIADVDYTDPVQCADQDNDGCDDCSQFVSGTGNPFDVGPNFAVDGATGMVFADHVVDTDGDGLCDDRESVLYFATAKPDPDDDNDGICDTENNVGWVDGDPTGVRDCSNFADVALKDPFQCADHDNDGCDDCSQHPPGQAWDAAPNFVIDGATGRVFADHVTDTDDDGLCDARESTSFYADSKPDPDDDNDGICDEIFAADEYDPSGTDVARYCSVAFVDVERLDPFQCADHDNDGCDDCSQHSALAPWDAAWNFAVDGTTGMVYLDHVVDTDGDGLCDDRESVLYFATAKPDPDDDNDGICDTENNVGWVDGDPTGVRDCSNFADVALKDPFQCADHDNDGCDDCSQHPPGQAWDAAPNFAIDGATGRVFADHVTDTDGDGLCDARESTSFYADSKPDPDDDNDGICDEIFAADEYDPSGTDIARYCSIAFADVERLDPFQCADHDNDGCDDCSQHLDDGNVWDIGDNFVIDVATGRVFVDDDKDTDNDGLCDNRESADYYADANPDIDDDDDLWTDEMETICGTTIDDAASQPLDGSGHLDCPAAEVVLSFADDIGSRTDEGPSAQLFPQGDSSALATVDWANTLICDLPATDGSAAAEAAGHGTLGVSNCVAATDANLDLTDSRSPRAVLTGPELSKFLLSGTDDKTNGQFGVYWAFDGGQESDRRVGLYRPLGNPAAAPAQENVYVYRTHEEGSATANTGHHFRPGIDVSTIGIVRIHHNDAVPHDAAAGTPQPALWKSGIDNKLYSRQDSGRALVEFRAANQSHLGIEVVQLVEKFPDSPLQEDSHTDLGSRYLPEDRKAGFTSHVLRGAADVGPGNRPYFNAAEEHLWAVRKNMEGSDPHQNATILWHRPGVDDANVRWPYEYHRYTTDWPTDPTKYQLYVRDVDQASAALVDSVAPVRIPTGLTFALGDGSELFEDSTGFSGLLGGSHVAQGVDGLEYFWTERAGWSLVKVERAGTFQSAYWMGFEVVKSVDHDPSVTPDPSYEFTLATAIGGEVGTEIQPGVGWTRPGHVLDVASPAPARIDECIYGVPWGPDPSLPATVSDPESDRCAVGGGELGPIAGLDPMTGQIFAVNRIEPDANYGGANLEVWWPRPSRTSDPGNEGAGGLTFDDWPTDLRPLWPSQIRSYSAGWPSLPVSPATEIVIASTAGTGPIAPLGTAGSDGHQLYRQPHDDQRGYNPNDEHASRHSGTIYPLRDDLGTPATSEPYMLVKYRDGQPGDAAYDWRYVVFPVVDETAETDETAGTTFNYLTDVGTLIQPLPPIQFFLTPCGEEASELVSGPGFTDAVNGDVWARSPGDIVMEFQYPHQESFDYPSGFFGAGGPPVANQCIPWLDQTGVGSPLVSNPADPVDVTFAADWGTSPNLHVGQTLLEAADNLPGISGACGVEILYEESSGSVQLIDATVARSVDLAALPVDIDFGELSEALRLRIRYDDTLTPPQLIFEGIVVDPTVGNDYVLLNVMSPAERDDLLALSTEGDWQNAANALYALSDEITAVGSGDTPAGTLALTAGDAQGTGHVTLVFNNDEECGGSVSLEVIEVDDTLVTGSIALIEPECPFDETLTLRQSLDFGGNPADYEFQWCVRAADNEADPLLPDSSTAGCGATGWQSMAAGNGVNEHSIEGPGIATLRDNRAVVRYRYNPGGGSGVPWFQQWSDWTDVALAEGWIKRVIGNINPITQRAEGGGIQGAETRLDTYSQTTTNTVVSMISQAGPRYEGSVALNCSEGLNDLGLIEVYETVLDRGASFSIASAPPVDYGPANNALLLAASRIADFYLLLGNEAYADASDPTVAFDVGGGTYGSVASSSMHAFKGLTASLIDEELALLRGRTEASPAPLYNRLPWNFTGAEGEVAYNLNYNIQDEEGNVDGVISEADAKQQYPQGHGDAWGHYLTGIKRYYRLLSHPHYTWPRRSESVNIGGAQFDVDYFDERKFAAIAAARARTGAELVKLTYRNEYLADPSEQWQGYEDTNATRKWGVSEWGQRAGQAAYFDWVVGNSLLPDEDPGYDPAVNQAIEKIDRTTVPELAEVASRLQDIQAEVDIVDAGLNPLGLADDAIPFDISPTAVDAGQTHFEQIYDRAVQAMNNAIAVFNHANNSTQLLRRQADSLAEFQEAVDDKRFDYRNRLIEVYGRPYSEDSSYPNGYDGADLKNFALVDVSVDLGIAAPLTSTRTFERRVGRIDLNEADQVYRDPDTGLEAELQNLSYEFSDRYGVVKPSNWSTRPVYGEIQQAHSDLLQGRLRYERSLREYDQLLRQVEDQADQIEAQSGLNRTKLQVMNRGNNHLEKLNDRISRSRKRQMHLRTVGRMATLTANALAEFLPTSVGFSTDVTAPFRGAIRLTGTVIAEGLGQKADRESLKELGHQQALQEAQSADQLELTTLEQAAGLDREIGQLEQTIRREASLRLDLYTQAEQLRQTANRFTATLARGLRLQEERARFERKTAANVQDRRYKDMAFRVFRNEALQKYRAQFDLAARYVYLAAKAYDFDTTYISGSTAGNAFLEDIVRKRLIGTIEGGIPLTGSGLADPLKQMSQNFSVLKTQMGFNNPTFENTIFSLRNELMRIRSGFSGSASWREALHNHLVPDLRAIPEFREHASFTDLGVAEPAIVIPFSSTIQSQLNFFGWPVGGVGGGDSTFSIEYYSAKVREAAVWFANYNPTSDGLLSTPRIYLVPVGQDVFRSPDGSGEIRTFSVRDQFLPPPYDDIAGGLSDASWIPSVDGLNQAGSGPFGKRRKYADFRANTDTQPTNIPGVNFDHYSSRAVGRSVWNTRWLLVIPARSIGDRATALDGFIDGPPTGFGGERTGQGVSDIHLFFKTYSVPGAGG